MQFTVKHFNELSLNDLYSILRLRCEVFIVEQVAYQDIDNLDQDAYHLFSRNDAGEIIAYLRIIPAGIVYDEVAIGRVCVREDFRRGGVASNMLDTALEYIENEMNENAVHISAQRYLLDFYVDKGFTPIGEGYMEDGIPHISMIRRQ